MSNEAEVVAAVAVTIACELCEDCVEVWKIAFYARRFAGNISHESMLRIARSVLVGVAAQQGVLGDVGIDGRWVTQQNSDELVEAVMGEWRPLGRDPRMGEIGWLKLPDHA